MCIIYTYCIVPYNLCFTNRSYLNLIDNRDILHSYIFLTRKAAIIATAAFRSCYSVRPSSGGSAVLHSRKKDWYVIEFYCKGLLSQSKNDAFSISLSSCLNLIPPQSPVSSSNVRNEHFFSMSSVTGNPLSSTVATIVVLISSPKYFR